MNKTFKRIILSMAFTALFAVGLLSVTVFADDGKDENQSTTQSVTWSFDEDTGVLTISGTGNMTNYPFYSDTPWFSFRENITSVEINNGVTSIGNSAFGSCINLEEIEIPDTVTLIGNGAFYHCDSLTEIEIPDSVTSIGYSAFKDCTGLTSLTIGTGMTSIGVNAFDNCSGITDLTMPAGATYECSLRTKSFDGCTGITSVTLTGNGAMREYSAGMTESNYYASTPWFISKNNNITITIENGVTSIGSYAFYGCTGLTSIEIPDSVTSIGKSTFSYCSGLTSINILSSVTSIGEGAFMYCSRLNSITVDPDNMVYDSRNSCNAIIITATGELLGGCKNTVIPDNVTSIGDYAFSGCSSLTSVEIPDSVTGIGRSAFGGCTGMSSVIIGSGVTSIGESAFSGCSSLTSVEIPDSVTSISGYAFYGCSGITDLTMPARASIGEGAFRGCTGITSVTLTGNGAMREYNTDGFADNCYAFTPWYVSRANNITVTIEDGVTSIGKYAFYECTGLTSIEIPDSVTSIGEYAFSGCSSLTELNIADLQSWLSVNMSYSTSHPFYSSDAGKIYINGTEITQITIPDGVTNIGNYVFYKCTGLTSVEIPGSVKIIGGWAFDWCTGLNSATISDGVTFIGNSAFGGCTGLTSIEIPDSVTSISGYAFDGCSGITDLTIPAGAIYDSDAFRGCTGITAVTLTGNGAMREYSTYPPSNNYYGFAPWFVSRANNITIVIEDGVTSIGSSAFNDCTGLTSIEIPDSVISIGMWAFNRCSGLTDVYYGSSLAKKQTMNIGKSNAPLMDAMWHYTPCEHNKIHVSALAPTCTVPGNIEHWKCSTCNRYFINEECTAEITQAQTMIAATGHTEEHHAAVAATCTEAGNIEYWYCTTCKKYFSDAACTIEVTQAQTVIAAKGHTKEHHAAVAATCTEAGNIEYWYCITCKKYFSDAACTTEISQTQTVITAKGHTKEHHMAVAATCTEAGNIEYWYCTACKKYFSDEACKMEITQAQTVIVAKGHTKEHHMAVAATCTEIGNIEYWYCTTCKKYFSDEACTTEKSQEQTVIAAKGHTKEHHAAVEATCTEAGNIEYWYCMACKKYFSDEACTTEISQVQTVIAAKGHKLEHHVAIEATYDHEGNKEYWQCTACHKYFTDSAGKNETTWANLVIPKSDKPDVEKVFDDVKKTDWFADSVAFVYARGIMKGMGGTKNFAPGNPLQREQLAIILYRLENSPPVEYEPRFYDVPAGEWYTDPIIWAYKNGIITGYVTGNFGVGDLITREQFATMLYRYAKNYKHLNIDPASYANINTFLDASLVSDWAYEAMSWAVGNGIISGKDNKTRLDPSGNAQRCECAAMIERFMNKYGL